MKKLVPVCPEVEFLFGTQDKNLRIIEKNLNVTVTLTPENIEVAGSKQGVHRTLKIISDFMQLVGSGTTKLQEMDFTSMIQHVSTDPYASLIQLASAVPHDAKKKAISFRRVQPKNSNQAAYLRAIETNDLVFGTGPAGTGKTYLAVAMAVSALLGNVVERIVLVRPAVEAGERLGFLPGTLQEKVDPYLRPLYDALFDMVRPEMVEKWLSSNTVEIAPLAFMRGRTLSKSFVIMDEAQNTTSEQMKMFLTRLGENSKAVVTGDVSQIDLPKTTKSGLVEALGLLKGIDGIYIHEFNSADVVRHALVQRIVEAYEGKTGRDILTVDSLPPLQPKSSFN